MNGDQGQHLSEFLSWISKQTQLDPLLNVSHSRSKGWSVGLKHSADGPKELATVPFRLALSKSRILEICQKGTSPEALRLDKCIQALPNCLKKVEERHYLLVFLLLGLQLKSASDSPLEPGFWVPYFKILPTEFSTPLFYNDSESSWLVGTGIDQSRISKLNVLTKEFHSMLPALSHLCTDSSSCATLDEFKVSNALFWSRVLSFASAPNAPKEDDLHMVPFLDLFNHSIHPQVMWSLEKDSIKVNLNELDGGSGPGEICISYGDKSNSELLFLHGFILAENPNDTIAVSTSFVETLQVPLSDSDRDIMNAKSQFMISNHLSPMVHVKPPRDPSNLSLNEVIASDGDVLYLSVLMEDDGLDPGETLSLRGQELRSPQDLQEALARLPHKDVIQLRACTVLTDSLFYRRQVLVDSASGMEEDESETASGREEILEMIVALKNEHMDIIESVLMFLEDLTNDLANRESVVEYLQAQQS